MIGSSIRQKAAAAAFVLVCAVMGSVAMAGDGFVGGIDDLPLMPGLVENADAGMVFDAPGGRFVEAEASGEVTAEAVLRFYEVTLPELGWRRQNATLFSREGETLALDLAAKAGRITVRFTLAPATAPDSRP